LDWTNEGKFAIVNVDRARCIPTCGIRLR
jgi:hypothetical protein